MTLKLIEVTTKDFNVELDIRYATDNNITGKAIYNRPACYLHPKAIDKLNLAIKLAKTIGLKLCLFDGYRPEAAQKKLWHSLPDSNYITPPNIGSSHTRGIAIDLCLLNKNGEVLDMGTGFDDMSNKSHHGNQDITTKAQTNRYLLRGLMASAGWITLETEWWHYQLAGYWQLIDESILDKPLS